MIDKNKSNIVSFDVGVEKLLNIAYKKIEKSDYLNAIPVLKKALQDDEENVDAMLELATLYSKMGMIDVSNRYAYSALSIEHNEISLYLLGNNFFKMHMYDRGISYYKRLLEMYPEGSYASYVEMVIERYEDKSIAGREIKLMKMTRKGKKYIEKEQYQKAIRLFSMLVKVSPEHLFLKNNLAMAYFYNKEYDKAIRLCREVISKRRYDVHANCNLAMFYYKQKNKYEYNIQKNKLDKLKPGNQEEYIKLVTTYCEIKSHEDVVRISRQAIMTYSYDTTYMFFMAAAYYNLGKVNKSLSTYHDILKIDEDNYIAHYYIKSIKSLMKPKKIDYYNQLPVVAIIDTVKRLRNLDEMPVEKLKEYWTGEDRLAVIWGTRYRDDGIKRICYEILGKLANAESERDLRNVLFSFNTSDELKKDVLAALRLMDAKQPYSAYFSGEILDVKVAVAAVEGVKELERPQKVIDILKECMADDFTDDMLKECIDMYVLLLNNRVDKGFRSLNALCAVLEISVREIYRMDYDKKELVKRYKTTETTVEAYGKKIAELLFKLKSDEKSDDSDEKDVHETGKDSLLTTNENAEDTE